MNHHGPRQLSDQTIATSPKLSEEIGGEAGVDPRLKQHERGHLPLPARQRQHRITGNLNICSRKGLERLELAAITELSPYQPLSRSSRGTIILDNNRWVEERDSTIRRCPIFQLRHYDNARLWRLCSRGQACPGCSLVGDVATLRFGAVRCAISPTRYVENRRILEICGQRAPG
jgi:hypothetical protein